MGIPTAKWPRGAEAVNANIKGGGGGGQLQLGQKMRGGQLQTKNIIAAGAQQFVFPLFHETCHSLYRKMCRRLWITFMDYFVLRMFDFGGRWCMILKNRGW